MNSLVQLQQRRAELKAKIEQQRIDLKETFLEVREEIEPSFLLKKAIQGLFKPPKNTDSDKTSNFFERFPIPINFIVDLFIKNKTIAALLKMFAPAALKIFHNLFKGHPVDEDSAAGSETSTKGMIYGSLRKGVASIRSQLHKTAEPTTDNPEPTDN